MKSKRFSRKRTIFFKDSAQTKRNSIIVSEYGNTIRKLLLRITLSEELNCKKTIPLSLKMFYMPTLVTLILNQVILILKWNTVTSTRTQLNTNLLSNPKFYGRPPTIVLKKVGDRAEQPAVNDEEPRIFEKALSETKIHGPIKEIQRNPEYPKDNSTKKNLPKLLEKTQNVMRDKQKKLLPQEVKNYNLHLNPNPNYSDSFR